MPEVYDSRRPRLPAALAARVDAARGQKPFNRFVVETLGTALGEPEGVPLPAPARVPEAPEDVQVAAWEAGQASYREEGAGDYEREPFVD